MKRFAVDLAVDTVSYLLLMQLSTRDRHMTRSLIRSATTGPDV